MTIQAQCKQIEKQLASMKSQEVHGKTIRSLARKHQELTVAVISLQRELDRGVVYHKAGYRLHLDALQESVDVHLDELEARLGHDPSPESLSAGSLWTDLISCLEDTARQTGQGVEGASTAFRDGHSTIMPPDELAPQLAPTDINRTKIKEYREAYRRFNQLLQSTTHSAEDIEEVRGDLHPRLQKLAKEMDTDVPSEVQAFLRAAETPVGAPLTAMTPMVLEWLRDKDMENRFRVKKVK